VFLKFSVLVINLRQLLSLRKERGEEILREGLRPSLTYTPPSLSKGFAPKVPSVPKVI